MRRIAIAAALAAALAASATAGSAQDARLEPLRSRIAAGEIPGVHAVIVVQDGRTLAEWYFPGEDEQRGWPQGRVTFDAGTLHDVR
ncbi:MAG TPA: hypothetical protein VEA79_13220, partial [Phenylobacterium sp.]|nr:hypothetical protein [Phenylobacterium sp.]